MRILWTQDDQSAWESLSGQGNPYAREEHAVRVFSTFELWIVQDQGSTKHTTGVDADELKTLGARLKSEGSCSHWHVMEKRETTTVSFHMTATSWEVPA